MMFKKEMAKLIFEGKKTATRRLPSHSSKIYRVGSIQSIQTSYSEKATSHIRILNTYLQSLGDMTDKDVKAEGFESWSDFMGYLDKINHTHNMPLDVVRVYDFELVDVSLKSR